MRLHFSFQADPAAQIIRASPDMLPGTDTCGMVWPTDTERKGLLSIFRQIDRYWPLTTAEQARAIRDAVDHTLNTVEALVGVPTAPIAVYPDLEPSGLREALTASGDPLYRHPFTDPLWGYADQKIGALFGTQLRVRGQARWGVEVYNGWYHLPRNAAPVGAQLSRQPTWGTMPPEYEAQYGAEGLGIILPTVTAGWVHIYAGEGTALKGGLVSHRDWAYHAVLYGLRQYAACRLSRLIVVDWAYQSLETTRALMEGTRAAFEAAKVDWRDDRYGFAVAGASTTPFTTSSGTDEARAAKIAAEWAEHVAGPFAATFGQETH